MKYNKEVFQVHTLLQLNFQTTLAKKSGDNGFSILLNYCNNYL